MVTHIGLIQALLKPYPMYLPILIAIMWAYGYPYRPSKAQLLLRNNMRPVCDSYSYTPLRRSLMSTHKQCFNTNDQVLQIKIWTDTNDKVFQIKMQNPFSAISGLFLLGVIIYGASYCVFFFSFHHGYPFSWCGQHEWIITPIWTIVPKIF